MGSLELRLPRIPEVNDPFECEPAFTCKSDIAALEKAYLSALKRKNLDTPPEYQQKLNTVFEAGDLQKSLIEGMRQHEHEWQSKGYLLSVSKTAQNPTMWTHYADRHKGIVIGIDFDNIFSGANKAISIRMDPVVYSDKRPIVDVLKDPLDTDWLEKESKIILMTKSLDWQYERELRNIFLDDDLKRMQEQGFTDFKELNGNKSWFLRLNPASIKEVVFGLTADDSLKLTIRRLKNHTELQHIRLYQAAESREAYILDLIEQADNSF